MKRLFLIIMLFTSVCATYAQEVLCKATQSSPFFDGSVQGDFAYMGELQLGEIITATSISAWRYFPPNRDNKFIIYYTKDGHEYCIFPENLVPVSTDDFFDRDVFTDTTTFPYKDRMLSKRICKEMWVPAHYVDVLRSKDRETLPKYEPQLLDYNKDEGYEEMYGTSEWYDIMYDGIESGMIAFFNPIIYTYGGEFLVKTIKKHEYGYIVECFVPRNIHDKFMPSSSKLMPYFNWDLCTGETVTLVLHVDGEYMDIYINGTEPHHKFGTIVRVKEEFIRQYYDLIKKGACDLTNVQWPSCADGSMGPPKETPNITLTPKSMEESDTDVDAEDPQTIQNSAKTSAMPFWAWLAITGGAVVIAGGVVFAVKLRK